MNKQIRVIEERYLRIKINSHTGDKIYLKLPLEFVKKMIKNNALDIFNSHDDIIDSEKLLKLIMDGFKYNLSGEIAYMQRKNGDTIRIIMD